MNDLRILTNEFPIKEMYRGLKYIITHIEKCAEIKILYDPEDKLTMRVVQKVQSIAPNRSFLHDYENYRSIMSIEEAVDYLKGTAKRDIDWLLDDADESIRQTLESLESLQQAIKERK